MKNHMSKRIACVAFLVLLLSTVDCLAEPWQGSTQAPSCAFRSTSSMTGTGSCLPSAAINGVTVAGSRPSFPSSRGNSPMEDTDPFGDQTIRGTKNPLQPGSPVGDGILPLLLMAAGGALLVWRRRRRMAGADMQTGSADGQA